MGEMSGECGGVHEGARSEGSGRREYQETPASIKLHVQPIMYTPSQIVGQLEEVWSH